jgi:hypothetical protein
MAVTTIGPVRPVSTIVAVPLVRAHRAPLAIQTERDAGAVVTLVTVGLVLANILVWAIVAAGS